MSLKNVIQEVNRRSASRKAFARYFRGDPEEGGNDDQDELDPPLNQRRGAKEFDDTIIGSAPMGESA